MTSKSFKMNEIEDVYELVNIAQQIEGDVIIRRGQFVIDGKSLMGVMSLGIHNGAIIEYPSNEIKMSNFLSKFEG